MSAHARALALVALACASCAALASQPAPPTQTEIEAALDRACAKAQKVCNVYEILPASAHDDYTDATCADVRERCK